MIDRIVKYCPEKVLLSLRHVSKSWCRAASKELFHTIVIDLDGPRGSNRITRPKLYKRDIENWTIYEYCQRLEICLIDDDELYEFMQRSLNYYLLLFKTEITIELKGHVGISINREGKYCDALESVLKSRNIQQKELSDIQFVMALNPSLYFVNLKKLRVDLRKNEAFLQYLKSDWSQFDLALESLESIHVIGNRHSKQEIDLLFNGKMLKYAGYEGEITKQGDLDSIVKYPQVLLNTTVLYPIIADQVESICIKNTTLQQISHLQLPSVSHVELALSEYQLINILQRYPNLKSLRIHRVENVALKWPSFFKLSIYKLQIPVDLIMPYVRKPFAPAIQSRFESLRIHSLTHVILDSHWGFEAHTINTDLMEMNGVIEQFKRWCPNLQVLHIMSEHVVIPHRPNLVVTDYGAAVNLNITL